MTGAAESPGPFTSAYVERCRVARLLRLPGARGEEARRLERGDFYAWRIGPPGLPGSVRVSQIAEPRTVYIVNDRLWWTPRLDQLLHRIELAARKRAVPSDGVREWASRQLASVLARTAVSWEEAALEVLLGDGRGSSPISVSSVRAGSRSQAPP